MNKSEKKRLKFSLIPTLFFLMMMWIVMVFDYSFKLNLYTYGIYPIETNSLSGIFISPFLHGDFNHLISNTFPFLVLSTSLFFFYPKVAYKILFSIIIISGLGIWLIGRHAYHIGASSVIYGLASFLIFAGLKRKNKTLSALSFIIIFLYGSMVWGVLPLNPETSWEGHLSGAVTGLLLSFVFSAENKVQNIQNEVSVNDSEFSERTVTNETVGSIKYLYKETGRKLK
jgi:membrane associated rhomboid family serine protease